MDAGNPFNEQIPGKFFVGREAELQHVATVLAGLENRSPSHTFVAGVHGTGKTAFLSRLVEMAQAKDFVGIRMTLPSPSNEGKELDPLDVIKKVQATLIEGVQDYLHRQDENPPDLLTDWNKRDGSTLFRLTKLGTLDSDALLVDLRLLIGIIRDKGAKGILVCIDEAQRLPPSALSTLKNALQQQDGVLLMLAVRILSSEGSPNKIGRVLLESLSERAEGDIGASRLLGSGISMGPFATDDEALRCITERLKDGPIDFDPGVSRAIVQLADRVPSEIIRYAAPVWDRANAGRENAATVGQKVRADGAMLEHVVKQEHDVEVQQAQLAIAQLSGLKRSVLRALITLDGSATAQELAERMDNGEGRLDVMSRAILAELEDLSAVPIGLTNSEGTFAIASPVNRAALRIALGEG